MSVPPLPRLPKLSRALTKPIAEALGELIRVPIDNFRANNLHNVLVKANGMKSLDSKGRITLNPKLVSQIADKASFENDEDMQQLWAGLLVSSMNDSNLHFVEILEHLTKAQAHVLTDACTKVKVLLNGDGLVIVESRILLDRKSLLSYTNNDIEVLDQALDDLRRKDLITGGFDASGFVNSELITVTPTPLALHFYARMMGHTNTAEFYNAEKINSTNG
jgi:hypothetical protein